MSTLNNNNIELRPCSPVKEEDIVPWIPQETSNSNGGQNKGGYDYELEAGGAENKNRYECPICLLCLRDPMLTSCGHRFCASCIQTWFQKEGRRCPLDGVVLNTSDIFPDQCTRREILQSKVKCPYHNRGCGTLLPLNAMEIHVRNCSFRPRSFGSVSEHSAGSTNGGLCLVDCYYREVGCTARLPSADLQQHLDSGMPHHLQLLTTAYNQLSAIVRRDSTTTSPLSQSFEMTSPTSPLAEDNFRRQRSWDCARFNQKVNGGGNGGRVGFRRHESIGSLTSRMEMEGKQSEFTDPLPLKTLSTVPMTPPMGGSPSTSQRSSVSEGGAKMKEGAEVEGSSKPTGGGGTGMERLLTDLYQRLIQMEQKGMQQELIIQRLNQQMSSSCNVSDPSWIESVNERCCNGEYLWRLKNFNQITQQMKRNAYQVSYSPSFSTHPFGYMVCGRLNLNNGEVSLFLHFMQGQWDSSITWPFQGTVMFQIVHPQDTIMNITESLHSRLDAAAFHRPVQSRNPKGYGFANFCPLDRITEGGYLGSDDTLLIRISVLATNRDSFTSHLDNGDSCTAVDMYSTMGSSKANG